MEERPSDHRRRLLDAMAKTVASKGYTSVTIADLATEARVSKRSFYEQFRDKSDCFIALYEVASLQAIKVLQDALDAEQPWYDQMHKVLDAYLSSLARNPPLLCTLFIDIMAIGPTGLAARRRTTLRMAEFIVNASEGAIDQEQAVAVVGGIHEWVLHAVETHQVDGLPDKAGPATRLLKGVLRASAQPA